MPFSKKLRCPKPVTNPNPCLFIPPYRTGVVLRGYDVVEYHNLDREAKGVKGSPAYKYDYQNGGATYTFHFKNKENLDRFTANVEGYLPKFGGFCSWGFANEWGATVDGKTTGDPEVPPDCKQCINNPPWAWAKHVMGPPADTDYGWSVYQGGLYFNYDSGYRRLWEAQPDLFIARAQDRWTKYYGDAVGPINVASYPWNWQESARLTPEQQRCLDLSNA